jgi:hypothetical protein
MARFSLWAAGVRRAASICSLVLSISARRLSMDLGLVGVHIPLFKIGDVAVFLDGAGEGLLIMLEQIAAPVFQPRALAERSRSGGKATIGVVVIWPCLPGRRPHVRRTKLQT